MSPKFNIDKSAVIAAQNGIQVFCHSPPPLDTARGGMTDWQGTGQCLHSSLPTRRYTIEPLFLTCRTIKSTAIADGDPLNGARADAAGFAIAVVDAQMILKLARLVVGVAIV